MATATAAAAAAGRSCRDGQSDSKTASSNWLDAADSADAADTEEQGRGTSGGRRTVESATWWPTARAATNVRTAVDMGGELEARCKVRHKGSKSASNQIIESVQKA